MVKSYEDAQRYVCERLKVDTIAEARAVYLKKTAQERANLLYHLGVGGGVLGLSPAEYPNIAPQLRTCDCGTIFQKLETKYVGAQHDVYYCIRCPICGKRTPWKESSLLAFRAWDNSELDEGIEQLSLF